MPVTFSRGIRGGFRYLKNGGYLPFVPLFPLLPQSHAAHIHTHHTSPRTSLPLSLKIYFYKERGNKVTNGGWLRFLRGTARVTGRERKGSCRPGAERQTQRAHA